jgi:hypothetical protein
MHGWMDGWKEGGQFLNIISSNSSSKKRGERRQKRGERSEERVVINMEATSYPNTVHIVNQFF